ncbi:MAG: U32 family peptidase [Elusimicrobiota bacterium]|jgi:putative protease|nr:U32 family peptidase [Elusimicrobiota bacterium]
MTKNYNLQSPAKPELMLPAGNLDCLKTAFLYGADSVYVGAPAMSLRARTKFPIDDLYQGFKIARSHEKKIYFALNIFSKNSDMERLNQSAELIEDMRPDGIIVSDPGVFIYLKNRLPDIPLHISTQANVCSSLTAKFWQSLGAKMCVLGRETTFLQSLQIKQEVPNLKFEIFVHGAMCISYSGRCLMSAFMANRSANAGQCAHSCRWKYKSKLVLTEELRPQENLEMFEDERGSYIMNSKDLCLMPKLDKILAAQFNALKIEGRTKSPYYTAQTARVYRNAIDDYFLNPQTWSYKPYMDELQTLQNRGYTLGFFDGQPDEYAQDYEDTASKSDWRNAGYIINSSEDFLEIEICHKLKKGDRVQVLTPFKFKPIDITIDQIYDNLNKCFVDNISAGKPKQSVKIFAKNLEIFPKHTVMRIKIS